jgi:hypothetical protein
MVWLEVAPPARELGAISSASIVLAPLAVPSLDVFPIRQPCVAAAHVDNRLREVGVPPQVCSHACRVREPEDAGGFGGTNEVGWIEIRRQ